MIKKIFIGLIFISTIINIFSNPLMIDIDKGKYIMGYSLYEKNSKIDDDGIPDILYTEHQVLLDKFKISKYEITFEQFYQFLQETGYYTVDEKRWILRNAGKLDIGIYRSKYTDKQYKNYPVTRISYEDALLYCLWISKKNHKTYRLPTEAEWEYVASSGKDFLFPWGNNYIQLIDTHSNEFIFDASFDYDIYPVDYLEVDKTITNVFGLYGNAMEWCLDSFDPLYYDNSTLENPLQNIRKYNMDMVIRGFPGYSVEDSSLNNKTRLYQSPLYSSDIMGFRIVEEIEPTIFNKNKINACVYYYADAVLKVSDVYLYEMPDKQSKKVYSINKIDDLRVYFKTLNKLKDEDKQENYWYCVRRKNTDYENEMFTGWISGEYLKIIDIIIE